MDKIIKARGAFLAMAVGEARGAPLSGLTQGEIEAEGGVPEGLADPRLFQAKVHARRIQRGAYEDETQAALCVADVLLREKRMNPDSLCSRFADLAQPVPGHLFGCWRRPHRNFRVAVRLMMNGTPWQECAQPSAGMGAASRGVPLALYFAEDAQLAEACILAGIVTHNDPRALAAVAAVAGLVRGAMNTTSEDLDEDALLEDVLRLVRCTEALMRDRYAAQLSENASGCTTQMGDAIEHVATLLNEPLSAAFAAIVERSAPFGARAITSVGGGFAIAAVPALIYLLLTDHDEFTDALDGVLAEGGATDTFGCLGGAFLGALHGAGSIPRDWTKHLPNIQQLEMRAATLVGAPPGIMTPLIVLEAQVTKPVKSDAAKKTARRFRGKLGHRSRSQARNAKAKRGFRSHPRRDDRGQDYGPGAGSGPGGGDSGPQNYS